MLTNYHSHSEFCDAKATIEQFVLAAIEAGFSHWGVSAHSPLPMLAHSPWAIEISRVDAYLAEIERVGRKYRDQITVLAAMEIDYIDQDYNAAKDYFQSLPLDYRIGSVHLLPSERTGELIDVDCAPSVFERSVNTHFGGSLRRVVEAYYRALGAMVECGGFDFVGHPDKISSNATALSSRITSRDWYEQLVDDFFQLCARRGVVLEINTKAYCVSGRFFPDERHFGRIAQLGIDVVINSDAHRLERIATGLVEARELFKGRVVTF